MTNPPSASVRARPNPCPPAGYLLPTQLDLSMRFSTGDCPPGPPLASASGLGLLAAVSLPSNSRVCPAAYGLLVSRPASKPSDVNLVREGLEGSHKPMRVGQ